MKRILVIDVGGSHVKLKLSGHDEKRRFDSGRKMTPEKMVAGIRRLTNDWKYDVVSIGLPMPIVHGKPATEPNNLGKGWRRFDFQKALGKPVKLINDAAMQALGSYKGGRMLFLGLGTGLGSTLILDGMVIPLELGQLRLNETEILEDRLGKAGAKKLGKEKWEKAVHAAVAMLKASFVADYVVIGGGEVKELKNLPPDARRGSNKNAFPGGEALWKNPEFKRKEHTLVFA